MADEKVAVTEKKENKVIKKIKRFLWRAFGLCALVPGWICMELLYFPKLYFSGNVKRTRHIKGKAVLMCNHSWWFDAPLICSLFLTREVSTLTAKQVFKGMRKPLMLALSCIPVDRDALDFASLQECVRRLKNGGVVCSFPEGMLNPSDEILPFKTGTAYMAMHSDAPVYPIYIAGNYRPFQRLQIIIGEPIDLNKEFDGDTGTFARNRATKLLHKKLCELKIELEEKMDPKYKKRALQFKENFKQKLAADNAVDAKIFTDKWEYKEPYDGAQIRVKRGSYYHHGIYIGDNKVIHFGEGDLKKDSTSSTDNIIHETDISQFLKGGYIETKVYSKKEKKKLFSPDKVILNAKSHLGEGDYDFLKNNCEHFSYLCAFGVKYSKQTDNVKI